MRKLDAELVAIRKIMLILEPMSPVVRARALDYVVSWAESLGLSPPSPEKPSVPVPDRFAELDDHGVRQVPGMIAR